MKYTHQYTAEVYHRDAAPWDSPRATQDYMISIWQEDQGFGLVTLISIDGQVLDMGDTCDMHGKEAQEYAEDLCHERLKAAVNEHMRYQYV